MACYHARDLPVGGLDAILDSKLTVWSGMCWGAAGFVVFGVAPGLGLPPELPGMVAATLSKRQVWWVFTVACTFAALGLLMAGALALARLYIPGAIVLPWKLR